MTLTRPPSALALAHPDRWDPGVALTLAELAALAYSHAGTARRIAREAGWTDCISLQVGYGQLAVLWSPWARVVSVRGSDQGGDWRSNFRGLWRRGWDRLPAGCRVGIGWLAQAKAMLPELVMLLDDVSADSKLAPLFYAAHSAGVPIATALLAALRETSTPRLVAGFSGPRGWNTAGGRWYDATFPQTWGVVPVHRGALDVVSRVPPRWTGARQVGRRIILAEGRALQQIEDWRALEASHPVGWLPSWRVLSRVVAGGLVHPMQGTVGVLRRMAAEAAALEAEREAARVAAEGGAERGERS